MLGRSRFPGGAETPSETISFGTSLGALRWPAQMLHVVVPVAHHGLVVRITMLLAPAAIRYPRRCRMIILVGDDEFAALDERGDDSLRRSGTRCCRGDSPLYRKSRQAFFKLDVEIERACQVPGTRAPGPYFLTAWIAASFTRDQP